MAKTYVPNEVLTASDLNQSLADLVITVEKEAIPSTGSTATYVLKQGGVSLAQKIEITGSSDVYTKAEADAKFVAQATGKDLSTNDFDNVAKGITDAFGTAAAATTIKNKVDALPAEAQMAEFTAKVNALPSSTDVAQMKTKTDAIPTTASTSNPVLTKDDLHCSSTPSASNPVLTKDDLHCATAPSASNPVMTKSDLPAASATEAGVVKLTSTYSATGSDAVTGAAVKAAIDAIPSGSATEKGLVKLTSTYSATGTDAVTGAAVKAAIDAIPAASASEKGLVKLAATVGTATDAAVSGPAVTAAIKDAVEALDVTDVAETDKYVSVVSQTDGKISVTRVAIPVKDVKVNGTSIVTSNEANLQLEEVKTTGDNAVKTVELAGGKVKVSYDKMVETAATAGKAAQYGYFSAENELTGKNLADTYDKTSGGDGKVTFTEAAGNMTVPTAHAIHDYLEDVLGGIAGAMTFKGDASNIATTTFDANSVGFTFVVSTAGTYAGITCGVGDMLFVASVTGGVPTFTHVSATTTVVNENAEIKTDDSLTKLATVAGVDIKAKIAKATTTTLGAIKVDTDKITTTSTAKTFDATAPSTMSAKAIEESLAAKLTTDGGVVLSPFTGDAKAAGAVSLYGTAIASGAGSIASGNGCNVSGANSIAMGSNNTIKGSNVFALGSANDNSSGDVNIIVGDSNDVTSGNSICVGSGNTASGNSTMIIGDGCSVNTDFAVAIGEECAATEKYALAHGYQATAIGEGSLASGMGVEASGAYSTALGESEMTSIFATGEASIAGGYASGEISASGKGAVAICYSHDGSFSSIASGDGSHLEGASVVKDRTATGRGAHAEGVDTSANANAAHAEGNASVAEGTAAHAEGENSKASGKASHAGGTSEATEDYAFAHGGAGKAIASGVNSVAFGDNNATASGLGSFVVGDGSTASGEGAIAMGKNTLASGKYAVAIGNDDSSSNQTKATGDGSVAIGLGVRANGKANAVFGEDNFAQGTNNFVAGFGSGVTGATSSGSVAIGRYCSVTGSGSFGAGNAQITADYAAGFGYGKVTGEGGLAAGHGTEANGKSSCAINYGNKAYAPGSFVAGYYNESGPATTINGQTVVGHGGVGGTGDLFVVGDGEVVVDAQGAFISKTPANALEIKHNGGNVYIKGIGGFDGTNSSDPDVKPLQDCLGGGAASIKCFGAAAPITPESDGTVILPIANSADATAANAASGLVYQMIAAALHEPTGDDDTTPIIDPSFKVENTTGTAKSFVPTVAAMEQYVKLMVKQAIKSVFAYDAATDTLTCDLTKLD